MSDLDAIIIGAGHNGLTCAAYLAMAGLRVRVVERRGIVGGAAVTEEFHPGFRNSTAAYTVSLLQPKIIRDLGLHEHGLRIVERRAQNFLPLPDGRYLLTGEGRTVREIAKFSKKDAERYLDYQAEYRRCRRGAARPHAQGAAQPGALRFRPRHGRTRQACRHRQEASGSPARYKAAFDLLRKSAGEILDSSFDSHPIKAVLGFDAVVGNLASPYTPGSAYVLLHHMLGEVNGKKGVWGHAIGGMGAITQGDGRGCRRARRAHRRQLSSARGHHRARARHRRRAGGRHADPRPRSDRQRGSAIPVSDAGAAWGRSRRHAGAHERMEGGVRDVPHERRAVATAEFYPRCAAPATITPPASFWRRALPYMDQAYRDCVQHGWSRKPIIEMVIPSTLDDSLAPAGAHVASLFCQHVTPKFSDGSSWDRHRETVADLMIDTVEAYAPGFATSVIARQSLSPLDLERTFGLPNGDIFHGALTPDQLFSARPMLGYADYRMPVPGLYLVRIGRASGRRRDRRAGSQCGAGGDCGPETEVRSTASRSVLNPRRHALFNCHCVSAIN